MNAMANADVVLNGVTIDTRSGLLLDPAGRPIPLRRQSTDVLLHLIAHRNSVVSKAALLDAVWPGIAVTENSLSQCISEIRKALGDERQQLLKTVARRGYSLILPVETDRTTPASRGAALRTDVKHNPWFKPAAAALAATIAVAATASFWPPTPPQRAKPAIAVLPFADLSRTGDQVHIAHGFSEDVSAELARLPGLFVTSHNSTSPIEDDAEPPATLAARLGVRYLLNGSVRRIGDDIRVNAHLVDAIDGNQIWAQRFDGNLGDVFDLQDEVVAAVVDALSLKLIPGKAGLLLSGDTDHPEAYEAFRRGIEARRTDTVPGTIEALAHLSRALALDSDFGAAAAEMAWLYWDADDARRRALGLSWPEIDERLHTSLAQAAAHPTPAYHQLHAELLIRQNRTREALETLRAALALDPSDPWTFEGLSQALNFAGQPREARLHLDAAMRVDPGWTEWRRYQAGLSAFGEGDFVTAITHLDMIDLRSTNPWPKFYAAHLRVAAYAQLGAMQKAQEARRQLEAILRERGDDPPNRMIAQQFFVFSQEEDAERLLHGLALAGVPEWPAGINSAGETRLDDAAINRLVLGRSIVGHRTRPDETPFTASLGKDGAILRAIGGESATGRLWVQGNDLCTGWPNTLAACGPVFLDRASGRYRHELRFEAFEFRVR
jgi:adenylate cyclase